MEPTLIITLICALISAIVGPITVILVNHKLKKQDEENQRRAEAEAQRQAWMEKAYNEELRKERLEDFTAVIEPFKEEMRGVVKDIKDQITINTAGTVTILRDRMKAILDDCVEKKFAKDSDKANWMELYKTYKSLGGNHFREYVDQWKHTMEDLPSTKPTKTTKNK